MAAPWTELDRRIAQALTAGGGLSRERVDALNDAAWARRLNHNGSALLGAAIAEGILTREQADQLLGFLLRSSGDSAAASGVRLVLPPVIRPASPAAMFAAPKPAGAPPASPAAETLAGPAAPEETLAGAAPPAFPPLQGAAVTLGGFGATPGGFGAAPGGFGASPIGFGTSPGGHDAPPTHADLTAADADGVRTLAGGEESPTWPDQAAQSVILTSSDPSQRYELLERAADGAGERVRARDRRLARDVELRLAPPGADPRAFLREARVVAQLDHPSIPKVHDLGQLEGRAYVASDLLAGRRLDELLAAPAARRPPLPALLRVFLKLGAAVAHAHARGAVHGDLHTAHVVVGDHGEAWLSGWGRAVLLPPRRPGEGLRGVERQPSPLAPASPHAAPEVVAGDLPGPRSDVWGLGAVLHACLTGGWPGARTRARRGPAAPRELLAVTRKALATSPSLRYAGADDLVEDVRRFLDGRAVSADREGVARALTRLARGHPLPAAIGGVGLAALLGVAGLTAWRVNADLALAAARQRDAAAARERAEQAKGAADKALTRVRLAERQAQERRALASTLGGQAQTAQGLDAAARTLERHDVEARHQAEQGTPEEPAAAALRRALWLRLLFARGTFHLRRAVPPDPKRALDDLREVVRRVDQEPARTPVLQAVRADALLSAYLAARRLPGIDAEAAQATLREQLAACDGVHGRLGQAIPKVERLEAEADRLILERVIPPDDAALLAELERLAKERGDLALTHELLGRYLFATTGPGLNRGEVVSLAGRKAKISEHRPGRSEQAYDPLAKASYLDPVDPTPRVLYQRVLNDKYGLHAPWRWIGGWALDQVVRAAVVTPEPSARLAAAEYLVRVDRPVAAALLVEPLLSLPEEGRAAWRDQRLRAQLIWARGRLAGRAALAPVALESIDPTPELRSSYEALRGWSDLVAGKTQAGLERLLNRAPKAVASQLQLMQLLEDEVLALTDPRADSRAILGALQRSLPPDRLDVMLAPGFLARAILASRLGAAVNDDVRRAAQSAPGWLDTPVDPGAPDGPRALISNTAGTRAQLANLRLRTSIEPRDPGAHLELLLLWGQLDFQGSTEASVVEAQQAIVLRLERLGQAQAARQFAAVEAVDELWSDKVWIPAEAMPWRFGPEAPR